MPYPRRVTLVVLARLVGLLATLSIAPFSQPEAYHGFADDRMIWRIPNFLNVVSNLGFALVGLTGLVFLASARGRAQLPDAGARTVYLFFFAGLVLVAIGSAYYHFAPTTETLYWDRLAMTAAFMAFYAAVILERMHRLAGLLLMPVLIFAGSAATSAWGYGELIGSGDLRIYLLVQIVPGLTLPLMILLFPGPAGGDRWLVAMLVLYAAAIGLEKIDRPIFELTGALASGHTLKHLVAAAAGYAVLHMLIKRRA